jgi:hypothetical protein
MAYVNSGIEMKSAHYDWRLIIGIALFLGAVTVLVALKLVYPDFEPGKLLSTTSQEPVASAGPVKAAITPAAPPKTKPIPVIAVKPLVAPAILPAKVKTPAVSPAEKAGVTAGIICSAEDREAQLCQ